MKRKFALFLFAVLFLSLTPPFIPNIVYGFDGSNGEFGYWSWDGTNKILTIVANASANAGNTEANAFAFIDITNAIDYYSWSAEYNKSASETQFEFNFRILIGNGTVAGTTWFADVDKQITFNDVCSANWQNVIYVYNYVHLRFGEVVDVDKKITHKGVTFYVDDDNLVYLFRGQSTGGTYFNLYSCHLSAQNEAYIWAFGNGNVWHVEANKVTFVELASTVDFYDVRIASTTTGNNQVQAPFDTVFIENTKYAIELRWSYAVSLKNLIIRGTTTAEFYSHNRYADVNLVDVDSDNWRFLFTADSTGKWYRQYTFDLTLTNSTNYPVENANVTLTYGGQGGGTVGSWLTDSNGQIPQQILTQGFYNYTGGDTIYSYNPYNITISKTGYFTYTQLFTLNDKKAWQIALLPPQAGETKSWTYTGVWIGGIALCFVLFVPIGFLFLRRRR